MKYVLLSVFALFTVSTFAQIKIDSAEAEAVLAILEKRQAGTAITVDDWERVFRSTGYARLKKRENSLGRRFADDDFRSFVMSPELMGRADILRRTLEAWKRANLAGARRNALRYLPKGAKIRATVFPVIKPKENSFVFEITEDPAIFLYLDPSITLAQFENTVAHEFHHIGFGTVCPSDNESATVTERQKIALTWIGAFGEGLAMLAAAGGPRRHPHQYSKASDRERWNRDVARFDSDLRDVESFFLKILDGKLDEASAREAGFGFFGIQGPWYTVGWKMAVTIENAFGRRRVIAAFCDPKRLPAEFNAAIDRLGGNDARWSEELLGKLGT